jgi:hypothetical protein
MGYNQWRCRSLAPESSTSAPSGEAEPLILNKAPNLPSEYSRRSGHRLKRDLTRPQGENTVIDDRQKTEKPGFFTGSGWVIGLIIVIGLSYTRFDPYRWLAAPDWARHQSSTEPAAATTSSKPWMRSLQESKTHRGPTPPQSSEQAARPRSPREQLLETYMIGMRLEFTEHLMSDHENDVTKLQAFADREVFPRARSIAKTLIDQLSDSDVETLNKPVENMGENEIAVGTRFAVKAKAALEAELQAALPKSAIPNFRLPSGHKAEGAR